MPFRKKYLTYDPEDKSKHLTASIGGQGSFVGGNLSSRQAMTVVDSQGRERKGFFTANSYVSRQQMMEERLEKSREKWEEYRPLLYLLTNGPLPPDEVHKKLENFSEKRGVSLGEIVQSMGRDDPELRRKAYAAKHDIMGFLDTLGLRENLQEAYYDDLRFWNALDDFNTSMDKTENLIWTHRAHQKQAGGTSINLRNNAMSDYATLLGMPGAVARSVPMTLIRDGMVSQGSFMDNAEGFALSEIDDDKPQFADRKIEITGDAAREISNVHVLDFLCANVDRHWQNMFYKFDFSEPGKAKLTGIQGIDNDASFGVIDFKGKGIYDRMPKIGDIRIIDDDTARRVLMMKPQEMEDKIRLAGLSGEEVKAAGDRLTALQQKIRSGEIKRIATKEEWNEYTSGEKLKGLRTSVESRVGNAVKVSGNVFDEVCAAVEQYNKHGGVVSGRLAELPDAKLVEETRKYDLWNQIDQLQRMQKQFNSNSAIFSDPGIDQFKKQLDQTIKTMSNYSGVESVSESDRTAIRDELHALGTAASEFAKRVEKKTPKFSNKATKTQKGRVGQYRLNMVNAAKNIRAVAGDAATRLEPAQGAVPERPELHSDHTYQSLHNRIPDVTSQYRGKSVEFAELRKALEKVNGIDGDPAMTNERRRQIYDNLADSAERYLEYKIPDGNMAGLSDFARSRVRFAKDVLEFAEAKLDPLVREEVQAKNRPVRDVNAKGENPYTPVIYSKGDGLEYSLDDHTFFRFKREGLTPEEEYRKRVRFHGGKLPDDKDMQTLAALNPGKDLNEIFREYNRAAQAVATGVLAEQQAKAAAFDRMPVKKAPAPRKEKVPFERTKLDVIAEDPEEDAAGKKAAREDLIEKKRQAQVKEREREERFKEVLQERIDQAYDILTKGGASEEEYRQAVSTVLGIYDLNDRLTQYEQPNQVLNEQQVKAKRENTVMREQIGDAPDLIDGYINTFKESTVKTLGKSEPAFIRNAAKQFREVAGRSIPGTTVRSRLENQVVSRCRKFIKEASVAKKETVIKSEEVSKIEKAPEMSLHGNDPSFAKGQDYIEEQRGRAYNILGSPGRKGVKDEARVTIATCHSLSGDSGIGKTVQEVWSGKKSVKDLDQKTVEKGNKYIDAVKAVGKNPATFSKYRESTRRNLAPFLCTNDPSREKLLPLEQKCVNAHMMKYTPAEKYNAEKALVKEIKTQSANVHPEPGLVEKYLSMFDPAGKKAVDQAKPPIKVNPAVLKQKPGAAAQKPVKQKPENGKKEDKKVTDKSKEKKKTPIAGV